MCQGDEKLIHAFVFSCLLCSFSDSVFCFLIEVTFPLWSSAIRSFLSPPTFTLSHLPFFEAWLFSSAAFYHLGVLVRLRSPYAALLFLTWFSKPFLLLYALLFSTLGVYINAYTLNHLDCPTVVAATSLPVLAYVTASILCLLSGQTESDARTAAAETAMGNSILVLTMVRLTLPEPDSDTSAVLPFWTTFLGPVPLVLDGVLRRLTSSCRGRIASEGGTPIKETAEGGRDFRRESAESTSGAMTTTSVSCLSPVLLSPVIDCPPTMEPLLVDQKITVL